VSGAEAGEQARTRRWLIRVVLVVFLLLAVWAVGSRWDEVLAALRQIRPWAVPVAFVPALTAMLSSFQVWRRLLTDLGSDLPRRPAARVYFLAQLGKYAPGSVWSVLTQMELARGHRVPRRSILVVGVLSAVLAVTCALVVAVATLPFVAGEAVGRFWWAWLALPLLLCLLHPVVLGRSVDALLVRLGREPLLQRPSGRGVGTAALFQFCTWALLGLHAWVLAVGLGAPALQSLPVAIGGYALAHAAGQLAIGLPGGAGVREAVLTLVMATVLPLAAALVLALLSRMILVAVDVTLAGLQAARGPRTAAGSR
jgi:glycosyltransferase 2 family protein